MSISFDQLDAGTIEADQFLDLAKSRILLDVRSPSEFEQGHIPGACSLPLFSDEERADVGTVFKNSGRDAAVLRGLKFAGQRMADLVLAARRHANGSKDVLIHCWRGGMRSQSVAWLLKTAGLNPTVLGGGYKAYRRFIRGQIERDWPLQVLSGLTGAGKTKVLKMLAEAGEQVLDLEHLANHRGSAFGGIAQPFQPTTEQFENLLYEQLCQMSTADRIWVEDEGNRIGTVVVPSIFHKSLRHAPAVFLDSSVEQRIENLIVDYGHLPAEALEQSINKIRKRLGPQHADEAIESVRNGDLKPAIKICLAYYDKTYLKAAETMPRDDMPKLALDGLTDSQTISQTIALASK